MARGHAAPPRLLVALPWALVALSALGCGGAEATRSRPGEVPLVATSPAGPADAGDSLALLTDLASRGSQVAPGMRVLAQGEEASPLRLELPRSDVDLCVRGVFVADAPVRATLKSGAGDTIAEADATTSGTLGARGPVCIRRAQTLTLQLEQPARRVRYVVWAAP